MRRQRRSTSARSCVVKTTVALRVDARDEGPDRFFREHVEPDRRLIEVNDPRLVQHRGCEITAHSLTERELAHGGIHEVLHLEELREFRQVFAIGRPGNGIDRTQQFERLDERQIPIQLASLSEYDADISCVALTLGIRYEPGHTHVA